METHFSESGSLIHIVWSDSTDATKQFEVRCPSIARYFWTLFDSDVADLRITIDNATEYSKMSETLVESNRAQLIYTYRTPFPMQVVCRGTLKAFWSGSDRDRMELLQFDTDRHDTYLHRTGLEARFSQPSPSLLNQTQSPRMNKSTAKQRQQQQRLAQPENLQPILKKSELPAPDMTEWGIPPNLLRMLEVSQEPHV